MMMRTPYRGTYGKPVFDGAEPSARNGEQSVRCAKADRLAAHFGAQIVRQQEKRHGE